MVKVRRRKVKWIGWIGLFDGQRQKAVLAGRIPVHWPFAAEDRPECLYCKEMAPGAPGASETVRFQSHLKVAAREIRR